MGMPTVIFEDKNVVYFTLPNRPNDHCVVDREDYYKILHNTTCWYIHKSSKSVTSTAYIRSNGGSKHLHREILGLGPWNVYSVVDHLNRNGLDCRKINMKHTTHTGNMMNRSDATGIRNYMREKGLDDEFFFSYSIAPVKNKKRLYYQCYRKKVYIAQHQNLDELIEIIKSKVQKENQ